MFNGLDHHLAKNAKKNLPSSYLWQVDYLGTKKKYTMFSNAGTVGEMDARGRVAGSISDIGHG
jgi:hypothetical protein